MPAPDNQVKKLSNRLDALDERITRIERRLNLPPLQPSAAEDDTDAREEAPNREEPRASKQLAAKQAMDERVARAESAAAKRSAGSDKETEKSSENTGFKIFGAVGFFLILLGMFYMYNYAVENGWLGYGARTALGVIFSLIIVGLGEGFRRRAYPKFAQLLTGGGTALLYFSVYATYHFAQYRAALGMPLWLNTVLLLAVMAFGVGMALYYDSIVLACFAFLLGYVAAGLATNGHHTLITALILSAGYLYLIIRKDWPLAVYPTVATYLLYLLCQDSIGSEGARFAYVTVLFIVFLVASIMLRKRAAQCIAVTLINAAAYFLIGITIVSTQWHAARGLFVLALAVLYYVLARLVTMEQESVCDTMLVLAAAFLTISVPVQLDRQWITIAWALEGLLLVYSGSRVEHRVLRVLGYGALALAALKTLLYDFNMLGFPDRTYSAIIVTAACFVGNKLVEDNKKIPMFVHTAFLIVGNILLTALLLTEILDSNGMLTSASGDARGALLAFAWSAQALVLLVWGLRKDDSTLRSLSYLLFALTGFTSLIVDSFILAYPWRLISYLASTAGLLLGAYAIRMLATDKNDERLGQQFLMLGGVLLLTLALAVELTDGSGLLASISANARNVILTVLWAAEAVGLVVAGFAWRMQSLRTFGLVLFGVTILKILLIDLGALDTIYRIIVTILVGVIALSASFYYVRNKERIASLLKDS